MMTDKNLKKISANIIADSLNEYGQRLTTFVLVFPRIVLAEFNTHRMLSRNSASSRAIPFEKMVKMVKEDPFIPIKWMKDHKGMQGNEYLDKQYSFECEQTWLNARDEAIKKADHLSGYGLTKQICNRLLEPFMWHTCICTGTDWSNFFALRAHEQAEIHIQQLAYEMLHEYTRNIPKQLKAGEWHIPFGDKLNEGSLAFLHANGTIKELAVKVATARCARVSYLNFEGKDDYTADIKLHDMLLSSGHMSPFEHCARAMGKFEFEELHKHDCGDMKAQRGWCGNFRGFIQYRKMLNNENKTDSRVISREK